MPVSLTVMNTSCVPSMHKTAVARLDGDGAADRELDGIADQIQQHLPKASRIAAELLR